MSDPNVSLDTGTAPAPAAPPTPATSGALAPPAATSQATPAPAPGAAPEDRSNWIPPYRLKEAQESAYRRAQQEYAQQQVAQRAEMERYQAQIRALTGVQQPENPEVEAIRQQFLQIFPEYKDLREMVDDLKALRANAGNMQYLEKQHWDSHGRQMTDKLFSEAERAIGSPLTPEGKEFLHTAFVGYVRSSPQMEERYASDPSIVQDFLRMATTGIIDPLRRQATTTMVGRAPQGLPQDTPAGAPPVPGAPKPQNLDERAAMAWTSFNAGR